MERRFSWQKEVETQPRQHRTCLHACVLPCLNHHKIFMLHCIFSNRVVIVNVHNGNEDIRDETEEALASNPLMFASMLLLGVNFPMASSKGMGGLPFSGAYFLSKATTHVCTSLPLPRARQPQVTAPEAAHTLSRRLSALTAPLMWPSRSSEVDSPLHFVRPAVQVVCARQPLGQVWPHCASATFFL